MTTIEAICNQALDMVGEKRHIGNIQEGSAIARVALDAWGQTRTSLLAKVKPYWATKDIPLVLLKTAPKDYFLTQWSNVFPPVPWLFEYTWPADAILPLQIKSTPNFIPVYRPRVSPFRQGFDTLLGTRTILTNEPNAILVYIGDVLDPNLWLDDFTDAMIEEMAKVFKPDYGTPEPQQRQSNANSSG